MIRSARFRATILLLILALAATPVLAAGKAPPAQPTAPSLVARLWQALGSLVPWIAKGRGGMDQSGPVRMVGNDEAAIDGTPPARAGGFFVLFRSLE